MQNNNTSKDENDLKNIDILEEYLQNYDKFIYEKGGKILQNLESNVNEVVVKKIKQRNPQSIELEELIEIIKWKLKRG